MFQSWRQLVALWTALSFALLLATAAAHHHKNAVEEHACVVCAAVVDKLADQPVMPTLVVGVVAFLWVLQSAALSYAGRRGSFLLPQSRGPPRTSR